VKFPKVRFRTGLENIAYNGKSIGEVRAFEELKVQESRNVADIFHKTNLQKISGMEK